MAGIEETKQAVAGAFAVVAAARNAGADGYSAEDVLGGMAEGPLKDAVRQAYEGSAQIPAELGDLSLAEGVDLGQYVLSQVRELI